jgi:hypothetical protein
MSMKMEELSPLEQTFGEHILTSDSTSNIIILIILRVLASWLLSVFHEVLTQVRSLEFRAHYKIIRK